MTAQQTAELGIRAIRSELERLGGRDVHLLKEGNRSQIVFVSKNGNTYTISVRTKRSGTWQTSITYGKPCKENPVEREFWIFVDLGVEPHAFYPVPAWWIANDIHQDCQRYLENHGGHRKGNDKSTHHAIAAKRIESWKGSWHQLGLGSQ